MAYWLDLFTPYTWERFQKHGASVSGFRPRQRRAAFERVRQGDQFLCYLVEPDLVHMRMITMNTLTPPNLAETARHTADGGTTVNEKLRGVFRS